MMKMIKDDEREKYTELKKKQRLMYPGTSLDNLRECIYICRNKFGMTRVILNSFQDLNAHNI
jgi:hypothetical protein